MTHILIPREPSTALLRPFIGCNTQELHEAWAAMVRIAEVQHARTGSQRPAQIEEAEPYHPAAVAGPAREEIAVLRAEHGITSSGRGVKEFEQVDAFVRAVLQRWGAAPALEAPAAPGTPPLTRDEVSLWAVKTLGKGGYPVISNTVPFASELVAFLEAFARDHEITAAAPQAPAAPADPMDWTLPCDVTVGHGTIRKGCKLRTLVLRMQVLYNLAQETELAAPAAPAVDAADSARLDFVLKNDAFIAWTERDGTILQCQLLTQDEDEHYHVISGEHRFFNTPREAIDAAIAAQAKEGGAA